MEEAKIIKVEEKPLLKEELKAEVVGIATIENNIESAKDYAIKLKEYYLDKEFTEDTKKDAEQERAQINKQIKLVADFRKNIIAEYKKPIDKFETTAKDTEKTLKEVADLITSKISIYDQQELDEVKQKVKTYFDEYKISKDIDFVEFEQLGINITKGLLTATNNLTKKTQETITDFIDRIRKDLDLIKTLEFKEEILFEYKKTLKCADAIANVQDRHRQVEQMKQEPLTDEKIQEKISYVSAPVVDEKIFELVFKVRGTKSQLKELKQFLENGGYDYE